MRLERAGNLEGAAIDRATALNLAFEGADPRGQRYFWIAGDRQQDKELQGTDLAAVNAGAVSVTPLCLDLTHQPSMAALRALFQ